MEPSTYLESFSALLPQCSVPSATRHPPLPVAPNRGHIGHFSTLTQGKLNSCFVYFAKTTLSFINRPLQTGYGRNGVHELGNGPKLSIGDLGLPQIPIETEFLILDLEIS